MRAVVPGLSRRISISRLAVAVFLLAVGGAAIVGFAADASATTRLPVQVADVETAQVKPRQVHVGNLSSVTNLKWRAWKATSAEGRGTFNACRYTTSKCRKVAVTVRSSGRCWARTMNGSDEGRYIYKQVVVRPIKASKLSKTAKLPLRISFAPLCVLTHGALLP